MSDERAKDITPEEARSNAVSAMPSWDDWHKAADTIERLRADSERLDWLADPNQSIGNVQLPNDCVLDNMHSLRDAIDAAMKLDAARSARPE